MLIPNMIPILYNNRVLVEKIKIYGQNSGLFDPGLEKKAFLIRTVGDSKDM